MKNTSILILMLAKIISLSFMHLTSNHNVLGLTIDLNDGGAQLLIIHGFKYPLLC